MINEGATVRKFRTVQYAHIKQSITTRQAAENFGIPVNSHGMAVCPFHDDHNPSMKVDDNFYCFGCGATGDVITFTSRLFGISPASAARKLAMDFGISLEETSEYPVIPKSQVQKDFENWCHFASETLRAYNQLLFEWKFLAPNDPEEDFHFCLWRLCRILPGSSTCSALWPSEALKRSWRFI